MREMRSPTVPDMVRNRTQNRPLDRTVPLAGSIRCFTRTKTTA
jgi:hypothetical protein